MKVSTKDYVYRIRGQFIRDIAGVKAIIKAEQDRRIAEYNCEKPQVQMEIVRQIEELILVNVLIFSRLSRCWDVA